MQVTVTWTNDNPETIWSKLAGRLGREPTGAEATAEVKRILAEARDERLSLPSADCTRRG